MFMKKTYAFALFSLATINLNAMEEPGAGDGPLLSPDNKKALGFFAAGAAAMIGKNFIASNTKGITKLINVDSYDLVDASIIALLAKSLSYFFEEGTASHPGFTRKTLS